MERAELLQAVQVSRRTPPVEQDGTVASPICIRETHCGARAVLGPPVQVAEHTVNRTITCVQCGAAGEESKRTDL